MPKHKSPIALYGDQMREIKRRVEVIDYFLHKEGHALYHPTTTESICLQFRKILELIAFSSLIANKTIYSKVRKNFESDWNAGLLLKDLRRINPDFYPQPIEERPSVLPGVDGDHILLTDGYLTQDDFIHIYKKCGGMLHALNPYGSKTSYHYFDKSFPEWQQKVIRLLNCHQVQLVGQAEGQPEVWLIHMHEEGDDEVHFYEFKFIQPVNV